jgi:hypothetical protein
VPYIPSQHSEIVYLDRPYDGLDDQRKPYHYDGDPEYVGAWVRVLTKMSRAQKRAVEEHWINSVDMKIGEKADGTPTVSVGASGYGRVLRQQDSLVLGAVVDWNLTDEEGNALPLQPDEAREQAIGDLPEDVFDLLHRVAKRAVTPRTPAEQARFRDGGTASGEGGEDATEHPAVGGETVGATPVASAVGDVA